MKSRFSVRGVTAFERARAREEDVGAKRAAHRVDEPFDASRVEAVLPPEIESPELSGIDATQ